MAAAVPTAGSAYTYAYATIGEVFAWIIGWDLILEFALGAAVVARGWSGYLQELFGLPPSIFGEGSVGQRRRRSPSCWCSASSRSSASARAPGSPTSLVVIKVAICLFVIVAGAFFVQAANLTPFVPPQPRVKEGTSGLKQPLGQALFGIEPSAFGFAGILTAAAVVFFAYTGFEAVANMGEETRKPARDLPLGLLGTLGLCTVLYIGVSLRAHRDGQLHRDQRGRADRQRLRAGRAELGRQARLDRRDLRADVGDPRGHPRDGADRLRDGPRPAPAARGRPRSTRSGARRTASPARHHRARRDARRARPARAPWPTWSASARCSPSSWSRSRCRCCAAPSRT